MPNRSPAAPPLPKLFGAWLRRYRTRFLSNSQDGKLTQERLAELLAVELEDEALTGATISNWERGHSSIHVRDRRILLGLVNVLAAQGKITTPAEADHMLQAGGYSPLTLSEQRAAFPFGFAVPEEPPAPPLPAASALPQPTYHELFGVAAQHTQLMTVLPPAQAPWVFLISGIGGIGKTALADAVARACLPHFQQVLWVRCKPRVMLDAFSGEQLLHELLEEAAAQLWPTTHRPAAQQRAEAQQALKAQPYLVVVDNLELAAETEAMLAHAAQLAHPSKFLLTTRRRPLGATNAFTVALNELPAAAALALLRAQAHLTNQTDIAQAEPAQLEPIYRVVGGNPFALKLVVRLAAFESLAHILAGLQSTQQGTPAALYRHIYNKAWLALSPPAQALLQAMPLIAEIGGTREHLAEISALPEAQLQSALQELIGWSLLEVRGTTWERRYGIHRLTETFVRLEIIHWPPEPADGEEGGAYYG